MIAMCVAYPVIDPDVCLRVKIILCPNRIIHSSDTLDKADWVLSKLPIILQSSRPCLCCCFCLYVCVSPLVHYYLIDVWKTLICKAWSIIQHRAHYRAISGRERKQTRGKEKEGVNGRMNDVGMEGEELLAGTIHFPHQQIPLIPRRHLI